MKTRDQIRRELQDILGYTCETSAPNEHPTTEFITDRWMQPRLDQLVDYVMKVAADA